MALPVLDTTHSPVWVARFGTEVSVEEHRSYLAHVIESFEEGQRYAIFQDFRDFDPMAGGSAIREGVAQSVKEKLSVLEPFIVCEVRLISSPLLRAMSTVFDWISPLPWATRNVTSVAVAESWVRARMAEAGIPIGDEPFIKD